MDTTITNLLKSLAEALSPFLSCHAEVHETTVSDAVTEAIEEAVSNLPDVDEQISEFMSYNFDPADYNLMTEADFDPSDWGLQTSDEITTVVDIAVTEAIEGLDIAATVEHLEEHIIGGGIEEAMNAAVEAKVASAVYAALDAAGVVTGTTLLTYLAATMDAACRRRGRDEVEALASSFVAEGTEV